ncbi:hypothetical protein [Ectothiorhodospira lacustris]|uniref:hypothetical protein n=1 Tax=Ectothiorhodospira lacustris TaxID=2899127 RepID=UPI001EE7FE9D|nr:hypothetical protein [Ectothiorhodospira lacustris]MCG5510419.1 hypothetical protein [Ectothiorhodospira lacustris]MCG5522165.1 hypothetical protein [Ectothiorhodospira lacustris]
MPSNPTSDLPVHHAVIAYFWAPWHLRRMPRATPEDRMTRAVWCRDHCATLAGRWILLGFALWMIQISPLGFVFVIGGWPVLGLLFPVTFMVGIGHLVAHLVAQKKAGPPKIDPPVERDEE